MMLKKPKFWDKEKSVISIILYPFTLIVLIILLLKKKLVKAKKFNIPIICIGNIYIGGTGKTPTSIYVGNELKKLNQKPVILRKFYRNHDDEHSLIKKYHEDLILTNSREEGILTAQKKNFDSVILDDGFQDYTIKKDLNIICFNHNQLIGNGMILPSGPLRESLSSLKRADIVLINGDRNEKFEDKILKINKKIEFFYSHYAPMNIFEFKNKKLMAIAGIGNPDNFFQLLEKNNLEIEKKIIYPDHYNFKKNEFEDLVRNAEDENCQIVMTEKDFLRIKKFNLNNIGFLKVSLKLDNKEKFLNRISELYDKNN